MGHLAEALLLTGISDELSLLPEEDHPAVRDALMPGKRHRVWVRGLKADGTLDPHSACWLLYDTVEHPESEPIEIAEENQDLEEEEEPRTRPMLLLVRGALLERRPDARLPEDGAPPPGVPLYYFVVDTESLEVDYIMCYRPELPEPPEDPEAELPQPEPDGLTEDERLAVAEEVEEPELAPDEPEEEEVWGRRYLRMASQVELADQPAELTRRWSPRNFPVADLTYESDDGVVRTSVLREGGTNRVFAPEWEVGLSWKVECSALSPEAAMKGVETAPWAPRPKTEERVFTITVDRLATEDDQRFWILKVEDLDSLPGEVAWPAYELAVHRGSFTVARKDVLTPAGIGGSYAARNPKECNLMRHDIAAPWLADLLPWPPYVPADEEKKWETVFENANEGNAPTLLQAHLGETELHLYGEDPPPIKAEDLEEGEEMPPLPLNPFRWTQTWDRYAPWPLNTRKEAFNPYNGEASRTDFQAARLLEVFPPPPPEEQG